MSIWHWILDTVLAVSVGHTVGRFIGWLITPLLRYLGRLTMPGKRYTAVNPSAIQTVPFELEVFRNGEPEVHEFECRPQTDAGALLMYTTAGDDGERKAQAAFRMLGRMLRDDDGVPATWSPVPVPKPKNAGEDYVEKFRAPKSPVGDGKLHPMSDAPRWTDPAAGSSRRRWQTLMFEDEGITVHMETVSAILQDMIAEAAARPTVGSSR